MRQMTFITLTLAAVLTALMPAIADSQATPAPGAQTVPLSFAQRVAKVGGPPLALFVVGGLPTDQEGSDKIPMPDFVTVIGSVIRPGFNYEVIFDAKGAVQNSAIRYRDAMLKLGWRAVRVPQSDTLDLCLGSHAFAGVVGYPVADGLVDLRLTVWLGKNMVAWCY
jgi:hypothetical protein